MWWPMELPPSQRVWTGLVTVDINENVAPDFVIDLEVGPRWGLYKTLDKKSWSDFFSKEDGCFLPDQFDEVHAYEVLEHLGAQGNYRLFFDQFREIWRILKPGGLFFATVPSRFSPWLWGDPSHRRAILPETLVFLDQMEYVRQLDGERKTSMSDFRDIYKADFHREWVHDDKSHTKFILRAIKPTRLLEKK
jgi:SAM-dependent methyltransferase